MAKKTKGMKKPLKIILIVLAAILAIVLGYLAYVFISYDRIDDNVSLTADVEGAPPNEEVQVGTEYTIVTYNIGYGAYTSDYSFFMDGGKSSWAKSEEDLKTNIDNIGNVLKDIDADFVVLQEVDTDGTRSYHYNEYQRLMEMLGSGNYIFAQNFHSAFLMYPILEPHGKNNSGIVTATEFKIDNAIRRQLPISTSFSKVLDLDRCYSITRIPVNDGKMLCIYNMHISAYGADDSIREGQINMLFEDMNKDYEQGNYVICGGDYNHNLREKDNGNAPDWAQLFPREKIPAGFSLAFEKAYSQNTTLDTCRNTDIPYEEGKTFTVMVDGFIVSDNVAVTTYENTDIGFKYSDHNPVVMSFILG